MVDPGIPKKEGEMQSFLWDFICLFTGFTVMWVAITSLADGLYYLGGILLLLGLPLVILTFWIADSRRKV